MNKISLINFPISTGRYSLFIDDIINLAYQKKSSMVCVANVHMFIEAYKNPKFLQIINNADLITPDGIPLIWALRILYSLKQDRVAGMDLLPDLLRMIDSQSISVYFYGSTKIMLNTTEIYIKENFPKLKIAGFHSPPFGNTPNSEEREVINKINSSVPCVVFVVLGCPKQEKWMASMKNQIHTVMIGIGGALPVMLGIQKRAPRWMQKGGLEWLFRLTQEPQRLFKRYVMTNSLFLWILLKESLKIKVLKPLGIFKSGIKP